MRPSESFIEQPVRSLQTMLRVIAEDDKTQSTVIPDGIYGPSTMQAIASFQRKKGLPITGISNQETWESVVDEYEKAIVRVGKAESIEILMDPGQIYRRGDSGPYILLMQSMLTQLSLSYPQIASPDHSGTLDDLTSESLSAFQELAGLLITGELDRITWKHLAKQFTLSVHINNRS